MRSKYDELAEWNGRIIVEALSHALANPLLKREMLCQFGRWIVYTRLAWRQEVKPARCAVRPKKGRFGRLGGMYEYKLISKWSGWWGGFGSESDIAALVNAEATEGWRLVRSESDRFIWFYIPFIWRPRLLLFFERPAAATQLTESPARYTAATQPTSTKQDGEGPFVRS